MSTVEDLLGLCTTEGVPVVGVLLLVCSVGDLLMPCPRIDGLSVVGECLEAVLDIRDKFPLGVVG